MTAKVSIAEPFFAKADRIGELKQLKESEQFKRDFEETFNRTFDKVLQELDNFKEKSKTAKTAYKRHDYEKLYVATCKKYHIRPADIRNRSPVKAWLTESEFQLLTELKNIECEQLKLKGLKAKLQKEQKTCYLLKCFYCAHGILKRNLNEAIENMELHFRKSHRRQLNTSKVGIEKLKANRLQYAFLQSKAFWGRFRKEFASKRYKWQSLANYEFLRHLNQF